MSKSNKSPKPARYIEEPPFETKELRRLISEFLDTCVSDPFTKQPMKIGNYKWGVYAFYDYDGEPIYVGQTYEKVRTRIGRHLTNQRTDAVAMNVLDPFEVFEIAVWTLPQYQNVPQTNKAARDYLNALEYAVFQEALQNSHFKAVLNEKDPSATVISLIPGEPTARAPIVSERVKEIRSHPDIRIARRAATLARLAQIISERKVQSGLRRALLTQAKRLQWLADRRLTILSAAGAFLEEDAEED